jgi:hypothetical protein
MGCVLRGMAKSGHRSEMPLVDGKKELEGIPRFVGYKIVVDEYY